MLILLEKATRKTKTFSTVLQRIVRDKRMRLTNSTFQQWMNSDDFLVITPLENIL